MVFPASALDLGHGTRPTTTATLRPDFRRLLGGAAWTALPEGVKARFDATSHSAPRRYPGAMDVRMNWLGWLFAQGCRSIGTPLSPWPGACVPVTVTVRPLAGGAVLWERSYAYPGRRELTIASRKEASADGALLEVTRGGLGMRLALTAEDGALVFRSTQYFLRLGAVSLPIPLWLTPGRACVVHRDLGGGRFHFGLSFVHPLAGETFFSAGDFEDPTS
jgi:Domain of unknown function (DUF4166)